MARLKPAGLKVQGSVQADQPVEDPFPVWRRHAESGVGDCDLGELVVAPYPHLDAATLRVAPVGLLHPGDDRVRHTIAAVTSSPALMNIAPSSACPMRRTSRSR